MTEVPTRVNTGDRPPQSSLYGGKEIFRAPFMGTAAELDLRIAGAPELSTAGAEQQTVVAAEVPDIVTTLATSGAGALIHERHEAVAAVSL